MLEATQEAITDINKVLPPNLQLTAQSPPTMLWAALYRLYGDQVQGPKGHATWKDAALAELLLRLKAERDVTPPAADPARTPQAADGAKEDGRG